MTLRLELSEIRLPQVTRRTCFLDVLKVAATLHARRVSYAVGKYD